MAEKSKLVSHKKEIIALLKIKRSNFYVIFSFFNLIVTQGYNLFYIVANYHAYFIPQFSKSKTYRHIAN